MPFPKKKKPSLNTLCLSCRLVSITIDEQLFSQTIRQKSLNVPGRGPSENKYINNYFTHAIIITTKINHVQSHKLLYKNIVHTLGSDICIWRVISLK